MERMERIEDLYVRGFCAQGIVIVGVTIPMFTVSFPPAASLQTVSDGSTRDTLSSCL
jgi:hypothetical protein